MASLPGLEVSSHKLCIRGSCKNLLLTTHRSNSACKRSAKRLTAWRQLPTSKACSIPLISMPIKVGACLSALCCYLSKPDSSASLSGLRARLHAFAQLNCMIVRGFDRSRIALWDLFSFDYCSKPIVSCHSLRPAAYLQ